MIRTSGNFSAAPEKTKDEDAAEREAALRRLKAYRYLVEVPYDNLVLDSDYNRCAEAGAKLCEKLGRLEARRTTPASVERARCGAQSLSQRTLETPAKYRARLQA